MKPERSLLVFSTKPHAEAFCLAVNGFFSVGECPISPRGIYVFIGEHDEKTIEAAIREGGDQLPYSDLSAVMMWDVCKAEAQAKLAEGKSVTEAVEAGYAKVAAESGAGRD